MKTRVFQYPKNVADELQDLKSDIAKHTEIDYSYLLSEPRHRIFMSQDIYELQKSVASYQTVKDIAHSMRGIEGYKFKYRAKPKDKKWLPFFAGQVYRYLVAPGEDKYVEFSDHIGNPDYMRFFEGDRLLVRRVVSRRNRLQAMSASEDFVIGKDLYSLLVHDSNYQLPYVLALLNSSLISYLYYMRSTVAQKDDFRQTTLDEIRDLPVAPTSEHEQQRIAKLVEKLTQLKARIAKLNFSDDFKTYFHTQPAAVITLSVLLRWNELKPAQNKRLLDTERRHGTITSVQINEDADWLTFRISGKQTGNSGARDLQDIDLFSVEVKNQSVRTFVRNLFPSCRAISAQKKYMLDSVLEQRLPSFAGNMQKNLTEIDRIVKAYEAACQGFRDLVDDMRETEAAIDAGVFAVYKISPTATDTILSTLDRDAASGFTPSNPEVDLDEDYRRRVYRNMTAS